MRQRSRVDPPSFFYFSLNSSKIIETTSEPRLRRKHLSTYVFGKSEQKENVKDIYDYVLRVCLLSFNWDQSRDDTIIKGTSI